MPGNNGARPDRTAAAPSPAADGTPTQTRTACSYCGVGCGIVVKTTADATGARVIATVTGDKLHPANAGRLCTKGATHAEMVRADGRMHTASVRAERGGAPEPVPVDEAVQRAADGLRRIIDEHGPDAVALYVSGQMSLEAQYLATKLAKGFLRTVHLESNSRLCMASAGTGYKQSLGADGPPGSYADFDAADVFLVIGSNMADCHPILFLRMADRLRAGAKLIVVDPRRTATAARADLFLQLKPGTDLALLNGLLHLLVSDGHIDEHFIAAHTTGWDAMPAFLADYPPERVSEITGIPVADLRRAADWIGNAGNWMSCWTMGLNQSTHGTWNTNAICNLHLATGAICRTGSGPMSLTGQPNAMGGREMGYMGPGLPGQRSVLSAEDRSFVEQRWGVPPGTIRPDVGPGTIELFSQMAAGDIKACWIICTNPIVSVANRGTVITGLENAELVITQDAFAETATNAYADILLPATLWAESDAVMVNSERTVTLLPQSIAPAGAARPDWQLIAQVATAMGFGEDFRYESSEQIFEEIRGFWNPRTGYDLRGISYERLRGNPVQWPCPPDDTADRHPVRYRNTGVSQTPRIDEQGGRPPLAFPTSSGRAVFHARPHLDPREMPDDDYPLMLITGRLPHQWHTMTKTGRVEALNKLNPSPFLELNPADADRLGLCAGDRVEITSRRGRAVLPALVSDNVGAGTCFAPFHWNDEHGEYLAINAVTNDAVDADSLQPEFKACAVALHKVAVLEPPAGTRHPIAAVLDLTAPPPTLSEAEKLYVAGFLAALPAASAPGVPVLPPGGPMSEAARLWFDGLLAGTYSRVPPGVTAGAEPERSGHAVPAGPATADGGLVLLWSSQTGTAEAFAMRCTSALTAAGLRVEPIEMDDADPARVAAARTLLVVTSTFGDGGPPDNGARFWTRLSAPDAPRMDGLPYAVIGMGDSSYRDFCGHARAVDERFAELGAIPMAGRVSCEPDDEGPAEAWLSAMITLLSGPPPGSPSGDRSAPGPSAGPIGPHPAVQPAAYPDASAPFRGVGGAATATATTTATTTATQTRPPTEKSSSSPATRTTPLLARLTGNTLLSGPISAKEVRQFTLEPVDEQASYQVGDALGISPTNAESHVLAWLAVTGLDGDKPIEVDGQMVRLADALHTSFEICRIDQPLLAFVAERNPDPLLATLRRRDNNEELTKWLWGRHAVDLLRAFPVEAELTEWLSVLRRLEPRVYSISSSPHRHGSAMDLTVSVVRYAGDDGWPRDGVCSTFLADRAADQAIPVYVRRSPNFRLPQDPAAPIIMVGPGTGIAPFRGFLHERQELGHRGPNWLFFGDQRVHDNFYYRAELQQMFSDGFLTRMDLAFSRDQRERIYVQHRMLEHGAVLWNWLQEGAHLYVCGDGSRMARDVDDTLLQIIRGHGGLDAEQAVAYRKTLTAERRYQRDVY